MSASVNDSLTVKPRKSDAEFAGFSRRIVRAYGRRVAAADPAALAELLTLRESIDAAIGEAVAGLRAAGFSWADVAAETGMSRQAAQQRWGRP